jgi:hypothetical protein
MDTEEVDPLSGRKPSEHSVCEEGAPLLCYRAGWSHVDESHLEAAELLARIWRRPSYAVAPNGHTCPFVSLWECGKLMDLLPASLRDVVRLAE